MRTERSDPTTTEERSGRRGDGRHAGGVGERSPSEARFLRPADVAEVLSVTEALVYSMMRSGELPAVKIGKRGQWRISRAALEAYIDELEREAYERARGTGGASNNRLRG